MSRVTRRRERLHERAAAGRSVARPLITRCAARAPRPDYRAARGRSPRRVRSAMRNRVALLAAVVAFALPAAVFGQKAAGKSDTEGARKGIVQKTVADLAWHDMPG